MRSLNQLAASIGLRLWEDFVAEQLAESLWVHLKFSPAGRIEVSYPTGSTNGLCDLCRLAGMGEQGLEQAGALLRPQGW